jgi:hypothetical protein
MNEQRGKRGNTVQKNVRGLEYKVYPYHQEMHIVQLVCKLLEYIAHFGSANYPHKLSLLKATETYTSKAAQ